jgi:hypothetical protein
VNDTNNACFHHIPWSFLSSSHVQPISSLIPSNLYWRSLLSSPMARPRSPLPSPVVTPLLSSAMAPPHRVHGAPTPSTASEKTGVILSVPVTHHVRVRYRQP